LVPQSELEEQVTFEHEPFKQVWFAAQSLFFCGAVSLEQLELAVPGLAQVYVL
jgi:hypothetical protein